MKRFVTIIPIVLFAVLLVVPHADASTPTPQAQFFHAHLASQTLPDNGSTTVATISFTTNQAGAIDVTSEQEGFFQSFSKDNPIGSGNPCGLNGQQDVLVAKIVLDGVTIESVTKPQLTPPQAYQCEAADLGITTTTSVALGTHTLTVVYTSSTNPNPPLYTGSMLVEEGTLSLAVATPATSN